MFLPALLVCPYVIGAESRNNPQNSSRHLKPKSNNDSSHSDETIFCIDKKDSQRKVVAFPPSIRASGDHKVSTQENSQKK